MHIILCSRIQRFQISLRCRIILGPAQTFKMKEGHRRRRDLALYVGGVLEEKSWQKRQKFTVVDQIK